MEKNSMSQYTNVLWAVLVGEEVEWVYRVTAIYIYIYTSFLGEALGTMTVLYTSILYSSHP